MSYLQECILAFLRQNPDGATLKTIAAGIGSGSYVCRHSIRGLEKFKLVESKKAGPWQDLEGGSMKKAGWPKARPAHSFTGRVGQAWKPGKVLKEGVDVFGNKKTFLVEEGHFRCTRCSAIVRIDKNGFAACESCGEVYNDSKTIRGTEYHMSKAKKKKAMREFAMSLVSRKI